MFFSFSCSTFSGGCRLGVGLGLLLIIGSLARLSQAACGDALIFIITLSRDDNSQNIAVPVGRSTGYGISTELKLLRSYVPYTTMWHLARASISGPAYFTLSLHFHTSGTFVIIL